MSDSDTQDTDTPTFREIVDESIAEDGYLKTGIMLGSLASIAFLLLVPEYARIVGCRLLGKEYKPPTHRMVEDVDGLEPRE